MSATHNRFGAVAANRRCTKSGAVAVEAAVRRGLPR